MKLETDRTFYTNPNYQKVLVVNARGINQAKDLLKIELIDTETQERFTLGELLQSYDTKIKSLERQLKTEQNINKNRYDTLLNLLETLKNEVREKGII